MTEPATVIARSEGVEGEIALRRRTTDSGAEIYELIVNGMFAMDSAETSTEQLLAEAVLERHPSPARLLVGGLGLGYTTERLLSDPRVSRVDVVELEATLVDWLRGGLVPHVKDVLADDRITITVADVSDVVRDTHEQTYDALLLDVDNGPEFLLHQDNANLYQREFLAECARVVKVGGFLAVWLAAPSPGLLRTMAALFDDVDDLRRTVSRDSRVIDYHVYLATRT